jgi:hypothetical protein
MVALFLMFSLPCIDGQNKTKLDENDPASKDEDKHVLGVIPNYRTAELTPDYHPISARYKLKIAVQDSFDYPLLAIGAAYAGLYQLENSHPQFGQGALGYLKRFGTAYTDQMVGNMMTEGIMPVLFKEDPRYFRLGKGSGGKRLLYALSRIVVCKTDAGNRTFNYAEFVGNAVGSAVGLSYYQDDRDFHDYAENVGVQLATDAFSQVLKEFWPDIKKRMFKKRSHATTT